MDGRCRLCSPSYLAPAGLCFLALAVSSSASTLPSPGIALASPLSESSISRDCLRRSLGTFDRACRISSPLKPLFGYPRRTTSWEAISSLRGGASDDSDDEYDDGSDEYDTEGDEYEDEDEYEEEDEYYDESEDDESEEDSDEEELAATLPRGVGGDVGDEVEYDEMVVQGPFESMGVTIGIMLLARKLDLNDPKIIRIARFAFIAYLVLTQIFLGYVRIRARQIDDRTPVMVQNPLSSALQSQLQKGGDGGSSPNDMVKNLASSFLSSETTVMEYDLRQAKNMGNALLFPMLFLWILHFKMKQVQPLLMQTASGFANLLYSPLFQVYVLGRNLQRPFKSRQSSLMEKQQQEGGAEEVEEEEEGEEDEGDDDDEDSEDMEEDEEEDDSEDEEWTDSDEEEEDEDESEEYDSDDE